ncbi:MAG: hypothetical protein ACHQ9S_24175 [Candidatus Binatia bacterium]
MKRFWLRVEQVVLETSGRTQGRLLVGCGVLVAAMLLGARHADAVPSFARQTGLACSACHTTFPELTAFGRMFKLHGYTAQGMKELEEAGTDKAPAMSINRAFPLSIMLQTSLTRLNSQQPGTQTANVQFPQALSLFLAGEITPHIGAFVQATYDGSSFNMDNTDIRYARDATINGKELLYGVTLNNNPTLEDPWHGTPAWGVPFDGPNGGSAPVPGAKAQVDGTLAQQVGGAGAYTLWDKHWYAAAAAYRTAHTGGGPNPPTDNSGNTIRDVAPYWRLAYQQNLGRNYFEVGTFGMFAQMFPAALSGSTDKFTDLAFDAQFERPVGKDWLSAHATYIYENQQLDSTHAAGAADNQNDKLHTLRLDGIYHWRERLAVTLGYFLTRGSNDATLYAPPASPPLGAPPLTPQQQVTGSINGSPDSDGGRFEIAYFPWQNVRLSAQYTVYTEFNGRSHNYNGTGRDAMDNNALYLLAWLMY